jgi:hypothetical protein
MNNLKFIEKCLKSFKYGIVERPTGTVGIFVHTEVLASQTQE